MGLRLPDSIEGFLNIPKSEHGLLYWVRGRNTKFKPFVANRVGEIQSLTNPEQWRHVPTKQNLADLVTRGLSVSALIEEDRCGKLWRSWYRKKQSGQKRRF